MCYNTIITRKDVLIISRSKKAPEVEIKPKKKAKNTGKIFEQEILESIPEGILYVRFNDSGSSFSGGAGSRFTPKNPCDSLLYKYPVLFFLELKSTLGTSLPFGNIKQHQIDFLNTASAIKGIAAGFIISFRELEKTYWIDGATFYEFYNNTEKKSINPKDIEATQHLVIQMTKKRTRYTYDIYPIISLYCNEGGDT